MEKLQNGQGPSLRNLYPQFSEDQLNEVEKTLEEYISFCLRVYERIKADPEAYAQFKTLTASNRTDTIKSERSKLPTIK